MIRERPIAEPQVGHLLRRKDNLSGLAYEQHVSQTPQTNHPFPPASNLTCNAARTKRGQMKKEPQTTVSIADVWSPVHVFLRNVENRVAEFGSPVPAIQQALGIDELVEFNRPG